MANNVIKTAKGTELDLNKFINKNELTMAVGNKKINARGDRIGPGGFIQTEALVNTTHIPDRIRTPGIIEESIIPTVDEPAETQSITKPKSKNTNEGK